MPEGNQKYGYWARMTEHSSLSEDGCIWKLSNEFAKQVQSQINEVIRFVILKDLQDRLNPLKPPTLKAF